MHSEDRQLASLVAAKDQAAAACFFDTYFARLFRFVARRVNDEDACEDIVQEAMIKAVRNLHGYRGEASLFTWLCQIGRNEISDYYKRHDRKEAPLVSLDDDPYIRAAMESLSEGGLEESERLALEQLVQLTLDNLPDRYGKALEWKYLEGLSVEEIAERFGDGVTAVQSMLARARGAFRKGFADLQLEREVSR